MNLGGCELSIHEHTSFTPLNCLKFASDDLEGHPGDLLLGSSEELIRFGIPKNIKNIVCIGDSPEVLSSSKRLRVNCLVIHTFSSLNSIKNIVSEMLFSSLHLSEWTNFVFDSLRDTNFRDVDIDKVTDLILSLFHNPIVMFSPKGEIISLRNLNEIFPDVLTKPFFDSLIESFISFLTRHGEIINPIVSPGFMDGSKQVIIGPVDVSNEIVAYCVVFELNVFKETDLTMMSLVTSWLAQEVRTHVVVLNKSNTFAHNFLAGIIENRLNDDAAIAKGIEVLQLGRKPYFYIMAIDISSLNMRFGSPRSVIDLIRHRIKSGIYTASGQYLVALMNSDSMSASDTVSVGSLADVFSGANISAGISCGFTQLKNAAAAFTQACKAIEIGKIFDQEGRVFFYQDCMIYNLISLSSKEYNVIQMFCLPQLLALINHDKERNTKYAYTLYTLIVSGMKQTACAKALKIHRTTMQYRVDKITDLLGMDVNDHYNILRLYISFGTLIHERILDPELYYQL